jgi:type IV secretory pathway component VirB8
MAFKGFKPRASSGERNQSSSAAAFEPMLPDGGAGQNDQIGRYPAEFQVTALEGRRYLWTARAFAIGMYISLALNVMLVGSLVAITPLKRVEPFLVSFSKKDQQVVRLEPFARGMPGYAAMTEFVVQEYVKMFQEIIPDEKETLARYKDYLQSRTDPGLYQSFVGNELPKFAEARSKGVTRTVEVKGITKISEGLYQVEFITRDFDRSGTEILNGELVATMRVTFLPQKVDFNARFVNPLGFTVQQYSVSKRR